MTEIYKEQIKKDMGFISAPQAKDPYRNNILWILRTFDGDIRKCFREMIINDN